MIIKRRSNLSGIVRSRDLPVTQEQLDSWEQGELIQVAMPHLSSSEREYIISGITPKEWEEAFGGYDE